MAQQTPRGVGAACALQALGNEIIRLWADARCIRSACASAAFIARRPLAEVEALLARLRAALPDAEALVAWTAALPLPADEQEFTCRRAAAPRRISDERGPAGVRSRA